MEGDPFLYDLFDSVRQRLKLPMGVEEYADLLQVIRSGTGVVGREELRGICETLWIKNTSQRMAFRQLYAEMMQADLEKALAFFRKTDPDTAKEEEETSASRDKRESGEDRQTGNISTDKKTGEEAAEQEDKSGITDGKGPAAEVRLEMEETSAGGVSLHDEDESRFHSIKAHRYILSESYLPVSDRQMRQGWRFLRTATESGFSDRIDPERTVRKVARQGFFESLVFQPLHENKVRLVILMDYKGSMVAFHALGEHLMASAREGGGQQRPLVYYFHDCPGEYLYPRPDRSKALAVRQLLSRWSGKYTRVMIFSDAGAARGRLDIDRLEATWDFLDQLKLNVRQVVWLNPVHRERWIGTTAEHIAGIVPMFEMTEAGFRAAIRQLRGKAM